MAIELIETYKNLVATCIERLKEVKKDLHKAEEEQKVISAKVSEICERRDNLEKDIIDLQNVTLAEIPLEELREELRDIDATATYAKYPKGTAPKVRGWVSHNIPSRYYIGELSRAKAPQVMANYKFEFVRCFITNLREYKIDSERYGYELINGKPLYQYLKVDSIEESENGDRYAKFSLGIIAWDNIPVKINLATLKKIAGTSLETAIMNILKRHENAETV